MIEPETLNTLLHSPDSASRQQALELLRSLPTPRTVALVSDLFPRRRVRHLRLDRVCLDGLTLRSEAQRWWLTWKLSAR
jgi:hypothetical protein